MFESIKKLFQRPKTQEPSPPALEELVPPTTPEARARFYASFCVQDLTSCELRKSGIPDDRLASVWSRFKDMRDREFTAVCNLYRNNGCDIVLSSKDATDSELKRAAQKFAELAGGGACGEIRRRHDESYLIISLRCRELGQASLADLLELIAGDPPVTRAERRKISRMKRTAAGREAAAHFPAASGEFKDLSLPFVYYRELTEAALKQSGFPPGKIQDNSNTPAGIEA